MYYTIERCEPGEIPRPPEFRLWRAAYRALTTAAAQPESFAAAVLARYLHLTGAAPETVRVSVRRAGVDLCTVHGG